MFQSVFPPARHTLSRYAIVYTSPNIAVSPINCSLYILRCTLCASLPTSFEHDIERSRKTRTGENILEMLFNGMMLGKTAITSKPLI